MDENAHAGAKGIVMEDWIGSSGLHLLNIGSVSTFNNDRAQTCIDISVAGETILN